MGAPEVLILPQAPSADRLPPDVRDAVARYRFNTDDGRSFLLTLDHGRLALEERAGTADCVVSCSMEAFHRLLSGESNLLTAFMRSELRMTGKLPEARLLYRFMRLTRDGGHQP